MLNNTDVINNLIHNDIFVYCLMGLLLCTCSLYCITRYKYNNLLSMFLFSNGGYDYDGYGDNDN